MSLESGASAGDTSRWQGGWTPTPDGSDPEPGDELPPLFDPWLSRPPEPPRRPRASSAAIAAAVLSILGPPGALAALALATRALRRGHDGSPPRGAVLPSPPSPSPS